MGKAADTISPEVKEWLEKQKIFFVATAPLSETGHVNLSPKGLDSFRILSPSVVVYQDLTGSGIETIAHIKENKRIVIMCCAFKGPPKIVRVWGKGKVILPGSANFDLLQTHFPKRKGTRAFIEIQVSRVQDSCGYSVPLFEFKGDRDVLDKWADNKGDEGLSAYRKLKNKLSIDGLPGL